LKRYSEKIIDGFWLQSDPDDKPDTNLYIIDQPFSAISVRLGKIFVLLPWFDSPEDFYNFLLREYSTKGGHMKLQGSRLPWPRALEMNLDFFIKDRRNNVTAHHSIKRDRRSAEQCHYMNIQII
jgi:hypothetical protein